MTDVEATVLDLQGGLEERLFPNRFEGYFIDSPQVSSEHTISILLERSPANKDVLFTTSNYLCWISESGARAGFADFKFMYNKGEEGKPGIMEIRVRGKNADFIGTGVIGAGVGAGVYQTRISEEDYNDIILNSKALTLRYQLRAEPGVAQSEPLVIKGEGQKAIVLNSLVLAEKEDGLEKAVDQHVPAETTGAGQPARRVLNPMWQKLIDAEEVYDLARGYHPDRFYVWAQVSQFLKETAGFNMSAVCYLYQRLVKEHGGSGNIVKKQGKGLGPGGVWLVKGKAVKELVSEDAFAKLMERIGSEGSEVVGDLRFGHSSVNLYALDQLVDMLGLDRSAYPSDGQLRGEYNQILKTVEVDKKPILVFRGSIKTIKKLLPVDRRGELYSQYEQKTLENLEADAPLPLKDARKQLRVRENIINVVTVPYARDSHVSSEEMRCPQKLHYFEPSRGRKVVPAGELTRYLDVKHSRDMPGIIELLKEKGVQIRTTEQDSLWRSRVVGAITPLNITRLFKLSTTNLFYHQRDVEQIIGYLEQKYINVPR